VSDMTYGEAKRDAELEEYIAKLDEEKSSIIGSAAELDYVLWQKTHREKRLAIVQKIVTLTDAGLELQNPHQHKDLQEETKELVIELAQLIENAIEEYIEDGV